MLDFEEEPFDGKIRLTLLGCPKTVPVFQRIDSQLFERFAVVETVRKRTLIARICP